MKWDLELFERAAYSGDMERSSVMLLDLLQRIDAAYGELGADIQCLTAVGLTEPRARDHISTRICAAITSIFSDPNFRLSEGGASQFLIRHRWLALLFASNAFVNADHVLRGMNLKLNAIDGFEVSDQQLSAFCVLYGPESNVSLDMNALHSKSPILALGLGLVLISPRFLGSAVAHSKREMLLQWLPPKLELMDSLEDLPLPILHDVYMHCSYADYTGRHLIKKSINVLISRALSTAGITPTIAIPSIVAGEKPVLLVVMEWFTKGHSIYRTHSRTLEGARAEFYVLGLGFPNAVDEVTRTVFDEFIEISPGRSIFEMMRSIAAVAHERNVQILYMPSVGMFPLTMFLSNLRIAPIQVMALGHPATSHSEHIDHVIVEEDYVGDPACFSEELLLLPCDGMPYRPSNLLAGISPRYKPKETSEVIDIVVAATTMKINPAFLAVCASIVKKTKQPVHFHFLIGQAIGLVYPAVCRVIEEHLGDGATVHRHQPYQDYMSIIARCDMFLNPFPFGNTNGIIDTVSAGLVGVCKTGKEVFEHIDEGLFRRLNFPEWLITHTEHQYIDAAISLIESHEERMSLRKKLTGQKAVQILFTGRSEILGKKLINQLHQKIETKS
jgi:hypothetical protein